MNLRLESTLFRESKSDFPCRSGGTEAGEGAAWFCQLRALISCTAPTGLPLELAYVRWYETLKMDVEEEELGMQMLRRERLGRGRNASWERYDIIPIQSISRSVFLQQMSGFSSTMCRLMPFNLYAISDWQCQSVNNAMPLR